MMNFPEQQQQLQQQSQVQQQQFFYDPGLLLEQNKLLMYMLLKQQDDINAAQLLLSLSQSMTNTGLNHQNNNQVQNNEPTINNNVQKPLLKPHPKFRAKVRFNYEIFNLAILNRPNINVI